MSNPISYYTIPQIIGAIGNLVWSLAIPVGVVMIIYAAWLYVVSGGSPGNIQKAHTAITWAIIGLILVLVGSGLSKTICSIIGVSSSIVC